MIRIIDCKGGNAPTVAQAVRALGYRAKLAHGPLDLSEATHIILPGAGNTKTIMSSLKSMSVIPKLEKVVRKKGVPLLATGIGMQVLFEHSEENDTPCLGLLPGNVVKYDMEQPFAPQMGVYGCIFIKDTPLKSTSIDQCGDYYYHMNSFQVKPAEEDDIWAMADNDVDFVAAVQRDNIYGVQFRLERGGVSGRKIIEDFLELNREFKFENNS